jgi:hypothetical protein
MGDPNKIMGVPKPVFWIIVIAGGILAFYLVRKAGSNSGQQQEMFPATNPDYFQDQSGGGGGSGGLNAAGLPNIPGTNANPNPEPISDPTSQVTQNYIAPPPNTSTSTPFSGDYGTSVSVSGPSYAPVQTISSPTGVVGIQPVGTGGMYHPGPTHIVF